MNICQKNSSSTKFLWVLLLSLVSLPAFSHSSMFPDNFSYDNTNEGRIADSNIKSVEADNVAASASISGTFIDQAKPCVDGLADIYPCANINMRSRMDLTEMNRSGGNLNDIWGWTDLLTGREIAIIGRQAGTSFVDVTNPEAPVFIGYLRGHGNAIGNWRDIKVYQDFAFIVADGVANSAHGLQIFDLKTLKNLTPGSLLTETAFFGGFGKAHNIAINEDTGFAYVVGSNQCSGGLYMMDISRPRYPRFVGCFSADGYTHDAQCVTYQGPDTPRFNKEICVAYNEDTITIVDVSDKASPQQLARRTYPGVQYTHQGWFINDNHSFLIMNDEGDEKRSNVKTTSYIFDVSSLLEPRLIGSYVAKTNAIDHNLYTRDNYVFESNYRSGLRILDGSEIQLGRLSEKAYFDTIPCSDSAQFSGSWSSYIYFPSGNIVTSDIGSGLFILTPDWAAINDPNAGPLPAPKRSPVCTTPLGTLGPVGGGGGSVHWMSLLLMMMVGIFVLKNKK